MFLEAQEDPTFGNMYIYFLQNIKFCDIVAL